MSSIDLNQVVDNIPLGLIRKSNIHGYGLFAKKRIGAGEIICLLDGQVISWDLNKKFQYAYEWTSLPNEMLLVRPARTKYSFINHSRTPNLEINFNDMSVLTVRDIDKDEELILDYRKEPLPEDYIIQDGSKYL